MLCHEFCAEKLRREKRALDKLGSGQLEIDLLKKTCRFERRFVPRLAIVDKLIRKLQQYLESHEVPPETIRSATLSIKLTIGEREDQKDKSVMWFGEYDGFVGCEMDIRCTIRTADKSRKARRRGYVEWPKRGDSQTA
jgi:hypothetical protein